MRKKLILPLAATSLIAPLTSQAGSLLMEFTFDDQTLTETVSGQANFETGEADYSSSEYGSLSFNTITAASGTALELDFLRYLRIPLAAVAQSQGQFTVKFDYYHTASKIDGTTAWYAHSFALRDTTNGYGWSHGFRNPGNDFWSSAMLGLTTPESQVKNSEAGVIPKFAANEWHEYVLVFDGNTLSWYVDGVFAYSQSFNESFTSWDYTNSDIVIGARYKNGSITELDGLDHYLGTSTSNSHPGMVKALFDEIKIWDGALSANVIADGVDNYVFVAPYTQLPQTTFSVNSIAQSVSLEIDSNESWSLANLPGWITATTLSGEGSATLELKIDANALDESRQADLSINGITFTVSQSAYDERDQLGAVIIPQSAMHTIDYLFYDLKSHWGSTMSDDKADQLFVEDGFNGVRTSIYGTQDKPDTTNGKPAHPEAGVVVESYYEPEIQKIQQALARNPDLIVFASKKLNGQYSFPDWVMQGSGIIPDQYAILLADYIEFMESKGIPTHYLGLDNEYVFNEGYIWPDRFRKVVEALNLLATERGFEMPIIVGYEDYSPGRNDWMKNLSANGWSDSMDLYGTHYYPEDRTEADVEKLLADISYNGYKDRWHTELHWNTKSDIEDILEIEDGFASLLDMTDRGFNGLMWWDYSRSGLRGTLMQELTSNLLGYQPIMMLDHDGEDILEDGKVHTRAFIKGNQLIVWALNLGTETSYSSYRFQLATASPAGDIQVKQWSATETNGAESTITASESGVFQFDLPAQTVTSFSFELAQEPTLVLAENFETASENIEQGAGTLSADLTWNYDFSAPDSQGQALDNGRPFSGKSLQLTATEGTLQLSHTLANNAIFLDDTNASLKFKLLLNEEAAADQALQINALAPDGQELLNVSLVTDAQQQASLQLSLNQTNSITLANLNELNVGEIYDVTVSLNRAGETQTDVYYTIYRNQMFYQQGQTFSTEVIATNVEMSQFVIHSTLADIGLDEISLQLEKADAVPEPILGDLDGDQLLSTDDLTQLRTLLGHTSSDAGFNAMADVDQDGQISRRDYALLFGQLRQQ